MMLFAWGITCDEHAWMEGHTWYVCSK